MSKRNPIKTLRNQADKLFQIAGVKNNPACECCGSKESLCCHHFVPKSLSNALRYDLKNCIVLCIKCHFFHHSKADPVIHERMTRNKPAEWFAYIKNTRTKEVKTNLKFYQEAINKLK